MYAIPLALFIVKLYRPIVPLKVWSFVPFKVTLILFVTVPEKSQSPTMLVPVAVAETVPVKVPLPLNEPYVTGEVPPPDTDNVNPVEIVKPDPEAINIAPQVELAPIVTVKPFDMTTESVGLGIPDGDHVPGEDHDPVATLVKVAAEISEILIR